MKINSAESLDKLNREWSRTYITGKANGAIDGYTTPDGEYVPGIFENAHYK